jgi:hypothetical protein
MIRSLSDRCPANHHFWFIREVRASSKYSRKSRASSCNFETVCLCRPLSTPKTAHDSMVTLAFTDFYCCSSFLASLGMTFTIPVKNPPPRLARTNQLPEPGDRQKDARKERRACAAARCRRIGPEASRAVDEKQFGLASTPSQQLRGSLLLEEIATPRRSDGSRWS